MLDVKKARAKMEKEGLDAIIALTLGNVYYSTGYHSHFCFLVKEHIRPVVIPKAKDLEPFIICPDHEVEDFKTFSQIKNFVAFPTEVFMKFDPGPSDHATVALETAKKIDMSPLEGLDLHTALVRRPLLFLAKELKDRGLARGTIGVDCISLVPAATWEEVKKALPYATIKDASNVFFDLRKIKSAEEIDYISEATKITEAAIENSVAMVKEGVKHTDVVANLKRGMTGHTPNSMNYLWTSWAHRQQQLLMKNWNGETSCLLMLGQNTRITAVMFHETLPSANHHPK